MDDLKSIILEFINCNGYDKSIYGGDNIDMIKLEIISGLCDTYEYTEKYEIYMITNTIDFIIKDMIEKYKLREILKGKMINLQKLELPEQRSEEWYKMRMGMLTASSLACALGDDFFKSRDELILEKVENKQIPFVANPITEWGVKYEEIATKFYEAMNNLKIIEFGLIPHPEFTIFGASPDGICSNDSPDEFIGRMLEIKCPPKRKFTKTVPKHYWYQMQGQLVCCDLEECDFLQVKFQEYNSFDDYVKDTNDNDGLTENDLPKGCTLTYRKQNELKCSYLYPELYLTDEGYKVWIKENKENILKEGHEFVEAKWWYIERYECTLVKRDRAWWCSAMYEIYQFHTEVEYFKKNGAKELRERIKNKSTKRKKGVISITDIDECLI